MSSFSAIYTKTFKRLLNPQGYNNYKDFFYRKTDNICFFIQVKMGNRSPGFDVIIDPVPYCADLKSNEYDLPRGYYIDTFYKVLNPDVFTSERFPEFAEKRFSAISDEATINSFNTLCNDMENVILPYIHKFNDLKYCYNELIKLAMADGCKDLETVLRDYIIYGLSIKLNKYENAFPYVDFKISWRNEIIKKLDKDQEKLMQGDLAGTINMWSLETRKDFAKSLLRRNPNFIEAQIKTNEETIARSKQEIARLQTVREAMLSNNSNYLDGIVAKIEESSREHIRQMVNEN